jgi:uncharacterized protein YqgV (UPF0045/DUF77 family)
MIENKREIHYRYWLAILVAITILSFTINTIKDAELVNFINFASTITSLVLAVLAIVLTAIDSSKNQTLYDKINSSSDSIKSSITILSKVAEQIESHQHNVSEKLDKIPSENKIKELLNITKSEVGAKELTKSTPPSSPIPPEVFYALPTLVLILLKAFLIAQKKNTPVDYMKYIEIIFSALNKVHSSADFKLENEAVTSYIEGTLKTGLSIAKNLKVLTYEKSESNVYKNIKFLTENAESSINLALDKDLKNSDKEQRQAWELIISDIEKL